MKNVKLTKNGNWYWRDKEISYREFLEMDNVHKLAHIEYLKTIPIDELGTNDEYILNICDPNYFKKVSRNFLSIDEEITQKLKENVQVCETPDNLQILSVEDIIKSGEKSVHTYLDEFFKFQYSDWETNVRFHSVDKFIENTKNFMELDELTIKFIKAYKTIKSK